MSYTLSIRERILIRATATAAGLTGAGNVHRWDMRGIYSAHHNDLAVRTGDEEQIRFYPGNPGITEKVLPLGIGVFLRPADSANEVLDYLDSHWAALIETAVCNGTWYIEEGTPDVTLALHVETTAIRIYNVLAGESGPDEHWLCVDCDVTYRHDRDNPNQLATAIPARVVTTLPDECLVNYAAPA